MAKALTKKQIEEYWIKAGGNPKEAELKAAIALAESRGVPTAVNPEGPEHAEGLWQIKGQLVKGDPLNPAVSALNAVAKTKTQGNSAWATFTSGAYLKYVSDPVVAARESEGAGIGGLESGTPGAGLAKEAAGTVTEAAKSAASVASFLGKVSKLWEEPQRSAKFIGGGILLFMGLKTLTTGSSQAASLQQVAAPAKAAHSKTLKLAKRAAEVAAA
jgi:hypothetical protein